MKFKKTLLGITLVSALFLYGCKHQAAHPSLTKTQAVKVAQKPFTSGNTTQEVALSTDTSKQAVIANTVFGGKQTVYHINNQTISKGKSSSNEEWVDLNHVYLNGQKTWYKTSLEKLSGHTYAELTDTVLNNQILQNPNNKLVKAYKMKKQKNAYILTAKITDKKLIKKAIKPALKTTAFSTNQGRIFKQVYHISKPKKMTVKLMIQDEKLTAFAMSANLKLGKLMHVKVSQNYTNLGGHDFLKVPSEAVNAKNLPFKQK